MRVDARAPGFVGPWTVYHAEECRRLTTVVWIDDDINAWGEYGQYVGGGVLPTVMHCVRRIEIYPDRKFVIINPIEDDEDVADCVGRELATVGN